MVYCVSMYCSDLQYEKSIVSNFHSVQIVNLKFLHFSFYYAFVQQKLLLKKIRNKNKEKHGSFILLSLYLFQLNKIKC